MIEYCFICNPAANRSRSRRKFKYIQDKTANWTGTTFIYTENREDLKFQAARAAAEYDIVVACGGDGTVSDVAAALYQAGRGRLGILPLGSGNDFIKSAGIPHNIDEALEVLKNKSSRPVDLVKFNDNIFINTLGIGFDGLANAFASENDYLSGGFKYFWAAMKANWYRRSFSYELMIDDDPVRTGDAMMITAANGRIEGGKFVIAPQASLQDGKIDFLLIENISRWILPLLLPLFLIGKGDWIPQVSHCTGQTGRLLIRNSHWRVPIHADGEEVPVRDGDFEIRVIPSAIEVIS